MYGIVLMEKRECNGLHKRDINRMLDKIDDNFYTLELYGKFEDGCAMGFITETAAQVLDFEYKKSGLADFIAVILDNRCNDSEEQEYEYRNIHIWFGK